jgi:heme-degrading monooxygenase HmoA
MVVEITTFRLRDGVDSDEFIAADHRVQIEVFPNTPGYLRRTTARSDDGVWLVVVLWADHVDVDQFNAAASAQPAQAAFDELIEAGSRSSERYHDVGG